MKIKIKNKVKTLGSIPQLPFFFQNLLNISVCCQWMAQVDECNKVELFLAEACYSARESPQAGFCDTGPIFFLAPTAMMVVRLMVT
ncbi:MAG: hypothetical protein HQL73_05350 [Magnetococcales bacterium]|nr:hypothetical protein [Magnetococcales bacterium]